MSLATSSVQFGFFTRPAGRNTKVEFDGRIASRKIPQNDDFANGVVYGNKQLSGRSKFEMEILTCSYRFGTLKLGIARHAPRRQYLIPSIAETAEGHLVWLGDGIYANDKELLPCRAKKYSSIDLHDLKSGCRVGFDISSDGKLSFTVNGYNQGIAARNVYKEGFTVRPVVDLFGGCRVTITQALTSQWIYKLKNYVSYSQYIVARVYVILIIE